MKDSNIKNNYIEAISSYKNSQTLNEQMNSRQEYGLNFGLYSAKLTGWARYIKSGNDYIRFAFQLTDKNGNGQYLSHTFVHNSEKIEVNDDFDKIITALYMGRPHKRVIHFDSLIGMSCSLLIALNKSHNYIDLVTLPL